MAKPSKEKTAKPVKEVATNKDLIIINSKAMSQDVGPVILATLAATYKAEQDAHNMMQEVTAKRYDLLSSTTQAIVKAYLADDNIEPADAFAADKKQTVRLNEQLMIALGVKEYQDIQGKQKLVYSKACARYFPSAKDPKGDERTQQKATLRSNFVHMLKKCSQAATAIVDNNIETEMDKSTGTLKISGPIVQTVFGAEEVLLNEKQKQGGTEDAPTELKARPSFQALANIAAQDHGIVQKTRSDSRVQTVTDPELAMESLCHTLTQAINKIKVPTDRQRKALEGLASIIKKVLEVKAV